MKAEFFLATLQSLDAANVAVGSRSVSDHIEKLRAHLERGGDFDSALLGFRVAAAMARASTELAVSRPATKKKLTPERYLIAEARNGGKKVAMAKELDVTERGLRKYERENAQQLAMLRPEINAALRAMLLRDIGDAL